MPPVFAFVIEPFVQHVHYLVEVVRAVQNELPFNL